ncbi:efflux RND transporter permease subunit [bacterium]|nr:efflux RND transporter permease subunit [bacterium]
MSFVQFFLKKPIVAHFIFVAVMTFGIIATQTIPVEETPEINLGFVTVITLYPGAAPQEIERLITIPIEDAVANVEDIDYINSGSRNGKSSVFINFLETVKDIDKRVIDIQTEINKIPDLPSKNEMAGPYVFKIATGDTSPVINVMLSSDSISDNDFRDVAENLQRELTSKISGIKNVEVAGVSEEEIQIVVSNEKLMGFNLAIDDVFAALTRSNFRTPGGTLDISGKRYLVKATGTFDDVEKIEQVLVKTGANGQKLYLKDVAEVQKKFIRGNIESYLNGRKAVSLYIMRKPESNIVAISERVREVVPEFAKNYADLEYSFKNDQGEAIDETMSVLRDNAMLGMVLVSLLLFIFMGWRASFLAVIGIPFSFLATFFMMKFLGYTINSLSLFAMILVSGMLVDDAIVVIENVYRYLEDGFAPFDAVMKGTQEIMWPVISAIATTICAFLPLLMITGMIGKFITQFPIIVTLTLTSSLLEALLVLPVHLHEMKNVYNSQKKPEKKWYKKFLNGYGQILRFILRFRYIAVVVLFIVFAGSIFIASSLRIVLFGDENAKTVTAKMELAENTPIEKTREISRLIENYVIKELMPEDVESVVTIVGRVIEDRRWIEKEEVAEFRLDLKDYDDKMMNKVKEALRKRVTTIPEIVEFEFLKSTGGPPTGRAVDISVAGKDLDKLEKVGDEIIAFAKSIPGVVDLGGSVMSKINEIVVEPDFSRLEQTGVSLASLAETIRSVTAGKYAGRYLNTDGKELKIWIRFDSSGTYTLDDIRGVPVRSADGKMFRVKDVAEIKEVQSMARIRRRNRMREIKVGANVDYSKTTPVEVNQKLQERFGDINKEHPGMSVSFLGEFEEQQQANRDIIMAFLVAFILIYIILGIQFNSVFQPFIVMITLPLAFIGVAIGLWVSGLDLSMMAMISLVALAGIVVNDSIILVDFINNLSSVKDERTRRDILVEAGTKRLRPILLTTVTTVGGLVPMAIFATGSNKMWQPMAITIIWGISFATILTLFVIPVIYAVIDDIKKSVYKLFGKKA